MLWDHLIHSAWTPDETKSNPLGKKNLNHDSTLSKGRVIWHLDSKMQKFSGRESQSSILQTSRTTQKRSAMNIAIESYACSIIAKIPWPTTICQRFLPPMLLVILWTATLHIDELWLKFVQWKMCAFHFTPLNTKGMQESRWSFLMIWKTGFTKSVLTSHQFLGNFWQLLRQNFWDFFW